MLPINEYQKQIYNALKLTGYKVFDEVPENENLPVIMISDYNIMSGNTKEADYVIQAKIDAYSEYEGKKEINEMVSKIIDKIQSAAYTDLGDGYFLENIQLLESSITRMEDSLYVANLNFKIDINEVI